LEDALSFETSNRVVDTDRLTEQQYQQAVGEEARTLTFAELKALIEQGKTDGIPNNKLIPDTINVSPPLQALIPALNLRYHRTLPQARIPDKSERNLGKCNVFISNRDIQNSKRGMIIALDESHLVKFPVMKRLPVPPRPARPCEPSLLH